ncbi:MAG TPA: hypothetical protein VEM96_03915 [Pyrinomonadaceae bacterium]|nr:hypothetical protein [Pyrinomonadaceae bacterium]
METKRGFDWALLKEIFWRPGVLAVSILYFLLQLAFNLIAWTMTQQNQAKYQLIQVVTWRVWIAVTPILTVLLIVLIVRAAIQAVGRREAQANASIAAMERDRDSFRTQLDAATKGGTIKLLAVEMMPQLLALAEEWSTLHEAFLSGVTDSAEDQVRDLTDRTVAFLKQELDDSHAAMVKNAPPEHPNLHGRATRDKHYIGLAAAKLNKVNQIIEEQRRAN